MKKNKKFHPPSTPESSFSCARTRFRSHLHSTRSPNGTPKAFLFFFGWIQGLLNLKALGGWKYTLPETNILLMEEILHQMMSSLSHYLQGFIHPRWCRISSINSSTCQEAVPKGNDHVPTIHFQVRAVSFREGSPVGVTWNYLLNGGTLNFFFEMGIPTKYVFQGNSNTPLEHTPDPQPPVYEGNPFISYLGVPGVCSRGLLEFSEMYTSLESSRNSSTARKVFGGSVMTSDGHAEASSRH